MFKRLFTLLLLLGFVGAVNAQDAPPSHCHTTTFDLDRPWVFASVGDDVILCNWITGEVSPPLPHPLGLDSTDEISQYPPGVSPDGRYLVFGAGIYPEPYSRYSYDTETHTPRLMGTITERYDEIREFGWLTPTHFFLIYSDMPEWSQQDVYVADVTAINSLHYVISRTRYRPVRMSDPPGFQEMAAAMQDGWHNGPCILEIYDATTDKTSHHDTGDLCEYGIPIPDGSGDQLFRAIYPNARVVRFNVYTGVQRSLFTGEVETLGAVSPDGRWGLIGLGDSGVIDTHHDAHYEFGMILPPREYVVMDLETGEIVGRVPAEAVWIDGTHLHDGTYIYTLSEARITLAPLP